MSGSRTPSGDTASSSTRGIGKHPNASVALGSGSGLGALIVWIAGMAGMTMPAEIGAVVAGVVAGVALFIGKEGLKGLLRALWVGNQTPAGARS
jgi:hypothetical protein